MSEFVDEYQTSILTKEGLFTLKQYKDEKELERLVVSNAAHIFGSNSIYFDVKQKVKSVAKTKITDGLLLDLHNNMFWLVEIELSKHDPDTHIAPQVNGFIRALQKQETLTEISEIVFDRLQSDSKNMKLAKKMFGQKEVYHSISKMLRDKCGVLIVIDRITAKLEEIIPDFAAKKETQIIEFKTYEKDSKLIHAFTPLAVEKERPEKKEEKAIRNSWQERLEWASPKVRDLAKEIIENIEKTFSETIYHKPTYRWYYFYHGKTPRHNYLFAVLLVSKKYLHLRFVAPTNYKDTHGYSRPLKGWFFHKKGVQERGMRIDDSVMWSIAGKYYVEDAYKFAVERMKAKGVGR